MTRPEVDISYRRIGVITAPVFVQQISHTMMGVIDTVMVGQLGVTPLAAVGLGNYISWWLLAFVLGMIVGVNTLVAQAVGGGRPRAVGVAFWQGIYLGLFMSVGLAACWPAVPWIMHWTGATPEAAKIATEYMQIRLLGGFAFALFMACDNFYRGIGRTTLLMWCGLGQLALNCGLNYLLIFGKLGAPRLGPVGAAWGTNLAMLMIGAFLLWRILKHEEFATRRTWRLQPRVFADLVRLSFPIGIQYFMEMGGVTVFCAIIARLGDAQMAATNAVVQAWSIAFMGGVALSIGATTVVGQCVGADQPEAARLAAKRVMNLGYALAAVMSALYLAVPEKLMAIFVKGDELERLLPYARPLFTIVAICVVFDFVFHIFGGALRGAGETKYPMWVNIGSVWLLFVPATILLTPAFGLTGAWSSLILHVVAMAVLLAVRFRGDGWLKPSLVRAEDPGPRYGEEVVVKPVTP